MSKSCFSRALEISAGPIQKDSCIAVIGNPMGNHEWNSLYKNNLANSNLLQAVLLIGIQIPSGVFFFNLICLFAQSVDHKVKIQLHIH